MPDVPPPPRPVREVLGGGVLAGALAGLAAGAIDAVWSWGPAAQFVPGALGRVRVVLFVAAMHAALGALVGLALTGLALALSRASRLGELIRAARRAHDAARRRDPRDAIAGLALVLAGLPCVALALAFAYRLVVPFVTGRKEWRLVTLVAMGATLAAIAVAIPAVFLLGRATERALAPIARRWPPLASPWAPPIAAAAMLAIAMVAWVATTWETARVLPLRGPAIAALGVALGAATWRPGLALAIRVRALPTRARLAAWIALGPALLACVLAAGNTAGGVKAATAYTGLGGPIARVLRRAFDWDRDGYARFLGGGDCDDGDRTVHPGAPEVPADGVDQNCVGGDAVPPRAPHDPGFVAVPAAVPADFRVLVITIDTVRADHLGMYGYARPTSPHLDRLARDATVFDHAWAHAPSTRYSIPAILTGRLPLDVRYDTSIQGWPGLLPTAHTFAEALAARGFTGGAITNYWYFDRSRHMNQGFVEYDNSSASLHGAVAGAGPEQTRGSSSRQQTDKAIAFIDRHAADRWLLWVHYYDPHYGYEPHAEVAGFGDDRMARYDGELQFTDLHIGRLLDHLRSTGQYDRTVIVVTGDHGEGFGEHGVELHGYHLYAAQTKVPLIIRVPGLPGRRSDTPAGHVDILPTLVNLAGGAPDPEMMGRSLVDVIAGHDRDHDRVVFQQLSYENHHEMRAGASQRCHVIYNVSPDTSWEVYRVDRDPLETEDLADTDACADTRAEVERWYDLTTIPAGATEALLASRPTLAAPVDADLGDAVRLLGCEAPATARPGEPVALTWTFEARGRVDAGWKVFVHVDGPRGGFLNGDHAPARPFEWWQPGDFIRYTTTVTLPRTAVPGRYTVHAGLFRGEHRAPARSARAAVDHDAVACATFEVVR